MLDVLVGEALLVGVGNGLGQLAQGAAHSRLVRC